MKQGLWKSALLIGFLGMIFSVIYSGITNYHYYNPPVETPTHYPTVDTSQLRTTLSEDITIIINGNNPLCYFTNASFDFSPFVVTGTLKTGEVFTMTISANDRDCRSSGIRIAR